MFTSPICLSKKRLKDLGGPILDAIGLVVGVGTSLSVSVETSSLHGINTDLRAAPDAGVHS
jgi:hypothetical protein